jgi:hypothetical protein
MPVVKPAAGRVNPGQYYHRVAPQYAMKNRLKEVIGYFAIRTGTMNILCDGDACVIAGSQEALSSYILKLANDRPADYTIKKTRYGEILQGMQMGGVYPFDGRAYRRFLPLAKADRMNLAEFIIEDDPKPHEDAVRLMRVKWIDMT